MITLNTTIWEGDFDQVLDEKSWFLNYTSKYITEKTLIINNIKEESKERLLNKIKDAQKKQKINIIFVDEVKEEAKRFFNLNINESTLGYFYTIQYFVFILKCNQPYILNVSADCDLFFEEDYLKDSVEILKKDPRAITTTLPWSTNADVGQHEQNAMFEKFAKQEPELEKFHYSAGFSDQTFLADIEKLKHIDYTIIHPDARQFPAYGGDCFEKRLCSYFLREHTYRLIYKKYHYVHNMPPTHTNIFRKIKKLFKK